MRQKIIAGNWKMYKTAGEAETTIAALANHLSHSVTTNQIYIAAPFVYLDSLIRRFGNTQIRFGAQNLSEHDEGAYTGEISGKMLHSIGCHFVLTGHSERRQYFGETDIILHQKIIAAFRNLLQPIFCCGEILEDRKAGNHFQVVQRQVEEALFGLSADSIRKLVIAYEPVWAIGTGVTASPAEAQEMHKFIRNLIGKKFGNETSEEIQLLYGGSVKPENANELFSQADIDGGLVGGASLSADDFIKIIESI